MPNAKCSMQGCNSATYNQTGNMLNFHRIPKNPKRQKIWRDLCKNPKIMNTSYTGLWLCSLHFDKSSYVNNSLKPDAIPTLNLPENTAGPFSYKQRKRQTRAYTDENKSKEQHEVEHERDVASIIEEEQMEEHLPNEVISPVSENQQNILDEEDLDKPKQATEEYDDCESVNFSSSEDGESENETNQVDWQTLLPNSHLDLTDSDPGPSKAAAPTKPAEPVYESLPVISKVSTMPELSDEHTLAISSVIDKAVEECLADSEEDECSTFAAHVKSRMRRFDPAQKVIAQKLISDIMFMADTKQLRLASSIVNPPTVSNGIRKKPIGGSLSSYVIDSSDDDSPLVKKKK